MKKLITIFAALLITASQLAFAAEETLVPGKVKISFEHKFGNTYSVAWEKIGDVYVGRFSSSNQNFETYYSESGDLLAYGRYIPQAWVPQLITDAANTRFADYTISKAFEFTSEESGTSFYLYLENNESGVFARAYSDGVIEVVKKVKK